MPRQKLLKNIPGVKFCFAFKAAPSNEECRKALRGIGKIDKLRDFELIPLVKGPAFTECSAFTEDKRKRTTLVSTHVMTLYGNKYDGTVRKLGMERLQRIFKKGKKK